MSKVSSFVVFYLVAFFSFCFSVVVSGENLNGGFSEDWYSKAVNHLKNKEYSITFQDKTYLSDVKSAYHCPNRSHNFRVYFTEKETIIVPRIKEKIPWEIRFNLKEAHKKENSIKSAGNKITIENEKYLQEYTNSEKGLEQRILLLKKEKSEYNNKSLIKIDFKGNLRANFARNGKSVNFFNSGNLSVLTLSDLTVRDSDGVTLEARFKEMNGGIGIAVEDKILNYPLEITSILTYPSWTGQINQNNSNFGFSISHAGDVNGDGFSDVVIGAPFYDNGQLDEGAAFVYYGSLSGLPLSYNWHDESNFQNFQMGLAVSTAGDVNGDNFSDVIVSQNTNLNEGAVKLYYGSATGLSLTPNWIGTPNQINSWYGCSISTAGDINGDGYSDIIVGAERYDGSLTYDEGAAFVYFGSPSGLPATPNWIATSGQGNSYFGCDVSTAGDVNGDGYSDIVVGAKYWDNPSYTDEGQVFVYYGSSSGLSTTPNWTGKPNFAYSQYGCSVSTAGDVNGDGYSDVIVGAKWHTVSNYREGTVFVYYGSPTGLSTVNWTKSSNKEWANFGNSVSTAGDVNGDGYSDVLVGAINYSNGETNEGAAYLFLGSQSGLPLIADWMIEGNQEIAE
ncbi:MAG: FG-GAP-like repeat-containing protein, partial [Acidobacteria bacterium]|nr:FG-GAP-like repeat-containing protein [Acidobacteriota bacterium]